MWLNQLTVELKYNNFKILHSIEIKKKISRGIFENNI